MSPHAERRGQSRAGNWCADQGSGSGVSVLVKPASALLVFVEPVETELVAGKTQAGIMKLSADFLAADQINFSLIQHLKSVSGQDITV